MLSIKRLFSDSAEADVNWIKRTAKLQGNRGTMDVIAPAPWSDNAVNIFASHYLREVNGQQETSFQVAMERVSGTIATWAAGGGYIEQAHAALFGSELFALLVMQMWSPNSPVWYNVGVRPDPQGSACFIQSVTDSMDGDGGIIALQVAETNLFRQGSGTGTNLSTLRPKNWAVNGGGTASGPTSFMRGFDAWAGVTKSGGKTRRAAKMWVLNISHPDALDFVTEKALVEKMAHDLRDAGHKSDWNGYVYTYLPFQNANNSVRVTDEFMHAVTANGPWPLIWQGQVVRTVQARDLWLAICKAAHECGDPGIQFDTTINDWHTSPAEGRINASNPCSEYLFLDDSACNLASLNLRKFKRPGQPFAVAAFEYAVFLSILAQESLVSNCSYPTERIRLNSLKYRPLGLGYANLGGMLMADGIAYDSEAGRDMAASITSLLTAAAYRASIAIAKVVGSYEGLGEDGNGAAMERVIVKHKAASRGNGAIWDRANLLWMANVAHPVPRNAQVTVLAPTGTIGFIMDCDTTGIEPGFQLVSYKTLAGGGSMVIANGSVVDGLKSLGYGDTAAILEHVKKKGEMSGAPGLKAEHMGVFDTAVGTRALSPEAHVLMMAAAQPFLSGAISKTVNLPSETTPGKIGDILMLAWQRGLKAIAVYRDGCKASQPLQTTAGGSQDGEGATIRSALGLAKDAPLTVVLGALAPRPVRTRLPDTATAARHKFRLGEHEGYYHVGFYEDRAVGEIFVRMSKEGSTISGLLDAWAKTFSTALQYGAPLADLCKQHIGTTFPPQGFTGDDLRSAKSVVDYIGRDLLRRYGGAMSEAVAPVEIVTADQCRTEGCGGTLRRAGSCLVCAECGQTSGCS